MCDKNQIPYWGPTILQWPACKLTHVFVCRGKETVIIMLQIFGATVTTCTRTDDRDLCTPGVYDLWFDSPPRKSCVMWNVLKQDWTCGCTWQNTRKQTQTHTHKQSVFLWTPHCVHTRHLLWGPAFLPTGGNLSGAFSFNRHLGG
jgi:hypothetical protein